MASSLQRIIQQAQQAISVISNPAQSSVVAGGLAGVFSAEINNLRKQTVGHLGEFRTKLGPTYSSVLSGILNPLEAVLGGSPDNPIPEHPGSFFGLSPIVLIAGAGVLFLGLVFLLGRKSR